MLIDHVRLPLLMAHVGQHMLKSACVAHMIELILITRDMHIHRKLPDSNGVCTMYGHGLSGYA